MNKISYTPLQKTIAFGLAATIAIFAILFMHQLTTFADTSFPWSLNGSNWIWTGAASSTPCMTTTDTSAPMCPWNWNGATWTWTSSSTPWTNASSTMPWTVNGWSWNGTNWTFTSSATTTTPGTTTGTLDLNTLENQILTLQQQVAMLQSIIQNLQQGNSSGNTGGGSTGSSTGATTGMITPINAQVHNGSSIDFTGSGFGHEENVTVMLNGQQVTTAHADGGGNFSTGSLPVHLNNASTTSQTYTFLGQNSGISGSDTIQIIQ